MAYAGADYVIRSFAVKFAPGVQMTGNEAYQDQKKFIEQSMFNSGLDYVEERKPQYIPSKDGVIIRITCKKSKLGGARYNYDIKKKGEFQKQDSKGMKIMTRKVHKAKDELVESLKNNDNK